MLELTDDNFDSEVIKKKGVPYLVDFFAPWCLSCGAIEDVLTSIEDNYKGKLTIGKYDVEKGHNIAGTYGVISLPTLILFKYGKVAWFQAGSVPQAKIEHKIQEYL